MEKPYFPLFVDLSEKNILVAGGGTIATRRVESLLEFAGHITVIAPRATERIIQLSRENKIHWIKDIYYKEVIDAVDLVLAATDDHECNNQIVKDCRNRNIPVNTCHQKDMCDFYFPGIIRRENLVVGFTSGGQDHRKIKEIRERVEQILDGH